MARNAQFPAADSDEAEMIVFYRPHLVMKVMIALIAMNWVLFGIYEVVNTWPLLGRVAVYGLVFILTYYAIMLWALRLRANPVPVPREYTLAELTRPGVIYKDLPNMSRFAE